MIEMNYHPLARSNDLEITAACHKAQNIPPILLIASLMASTIIMVGGGYLTHHMPGCFLALLVIIFMHMAAAVLIIAAEPGREFMLVVGREDDVTQLAELLQSSQAARALRDEIQQTGRQIYVFDAHEMYKRTWRAQIAA